MIILEVLGHALFWLVMVVSIAIIPIGIPGTFVIVANALVFALATSFAELSWGFLVVLLVIAALAETVEFVIGAATAGRYGGSKLAMLGAIVGGFFGAIWLTPFIPPLGTILGAFAGSYCGASLLEYFHSRDFDKSLQVGLGALIGTIGGKLTKIAAGIAMVVMVAVRVY